MSGPKEVLASVWWFWRDWRASEARAMLSPLARGIYRELLDAHYMADDCSIPGGDVALAALAAVPLKTWLKVKDEILPWLPERADGRRQNLRALTEWERAINDRTIRRERAKSGGDAKARAEADARARAKEAETRERADALLKQPPSSAKNLLKHAGEPAGQHAWAGFEHASAPAPAPASDSESGKISSPSAPQAPDGAGGYSVHPDLEPQTGQPAGRSPRLGHPPLPGSSRKRPAVDVAPVIDAWNRVADEAGLPAVRGGGKIDAAIRPMLREEPNVAVIERAMRLFAAQPFIREHRYSLGNFLPNRGKYLPRAQAGDDGGITSASSNPFLRAVE